MKVIRLLIMILYISSADAKIYKCIVKGQTKFQETPCPINSSSGGEIKVAPNIVSTKGLRDYIEQDKIPKKLREQKERNARKAKRAWMNGEVKTLSKQQKKRAKLKKREIKQREKEQKARNKSTSTKE